MCGRFTRKLTWAQLHYLLGLIGNGRYNKELADHSDVRPTTDVLCARVAADGVRELVDMHWGLIPSWAKDTKKLGSMINARGETVAEKPSFRNAFKRRRCLILASGFYEWEAVPGQKKKQQWLFQLPDRRPFGFASIWETWKSPEGKFIESCSIITSAATAAPVARIHDRQPCIVPESIFDAWLDPKVNDSVVLQDLLKQCANYELVAEPYNEISSN